MMAWFIKIVIMVCFGTWLSCAHVGSPKHEPVRQSQIMMGTQVSICVYPPEGKTLEDVEQIMQAAMNRGLDLSKKLSAMDAQSELSFIHDHEGMDWIPISDELYELLRLSQMFNVWSQGRFDASVGAMIRLWKRAKTTDVLPDADAICQAKALSGPNAWELKKAYVRKKKAGVRFDLGGLAKGYVLDQMAQVLKDRGIVCFCLDSTSDVLVGDAPPDRDAWKVQVLQPDGSAKFVELNKSALSTSGDQNQHIIIQGQRYAHIMDPSTGLGFAKSRQATVIAPDACTADACATIAVLVGEEKAQQIFQVFGNKRIKLIFYHSRD